MPRIINQEIVFNDKLIIEKANLEDEKGNTFSRLRINRQDASAVLIYRTDTQTVILTRQFRYPTSTKVTEDIIEIVAGKIDEGEEPVDAAIREVEEEVGYRIRKDNIKLLVSCFSSPGYTSERFYI
ncbi:MAG: NUDIX hydrolase, partial [Bacteroidota bacterium]